MSWAEGEVCKGCWVRESKSGKNVTEGQNLEVHLRSEGVLRQPEQRSREPMGLSHRHTARQSTYDRTGVDDAATAALQMREDRGARMQGKPKVRRGRVCVTKA